MNGEKQRAVRIDRTGGPEVMQLADVRVGDPGPGEVRIRHHAIGLNFLDLYHRTGLIGLPLPAHLGMEGAGVIEAAGPGVTHLQAGDRAAYAGYPAGSYSDVRVMPAMNVCRLPDEIGFDTAAAMMLKGWTAYYLLHRCKPVEGLSAGDYVLFHAAAGGVGLITTQWAKARGLRLIGTAGTDEKCALALEHGASHAINYRREDFVARVREITGGKGVKVVYDGVGKDTFEPSLDCLAPFGLLVAFGDASGLAPPIVPIRLVEKGSIYITYQGLFHHIATRDSTQQMADALFDVVRRGVVKIPIGQRYALADVQQAHRDLAERRTTGCSILLP
ncbi:quinone oxidoreductase family protein [Thauera sinica]|uniref:Quinone oxidoreductase family protein n=1 Tax=Thauera sinica TaxID=2665146 RepID=A0ABW1ATJ6_9RHOO|nr:quinone oxidoreductase [Thauera sp. K11]ATE62058.1 quinone oxidoreductase [Thauera sp. K11]